MSNCFRKGGQNIFFCVSSCDKTSFQLCERFGTEKFPNMELYALVPTCTFMPNSEKGSSKFQSCRKGTQKHKYASKIVKCALKNWTGRKNKFLHIIIRMSCPKQCELDSIRLDGDHLGCIIQSTDSIIASHASVFFPLTYDEMKTGVEMGLGLVTMTWFRLST